MKFALPDGGGWQEIEVREGERFGDIEFRTISRERVDDVLAANARARNSGVRHYIGEGDNSSMMLLGSLSSLQAHLLMKSGVFWDDDALRRWFRDLDNYLWGVQRGTTPRAFKTALQEAPNAVQDLQAGHGSA